MAIDTETREGRKAALSSQGAEAVGACRRHPRDHEDFSAPTPRNYLYRSWGRS